MSRLNRVLDLFKRGDTINKVDEVQPPPKYPFGDLIIKNDDEIRASTAAYRKSLETDNDITAQMSGVVRTKEKEKLLDDIKIGSSSPADLTLEKQLESQLTTSPLVPSDKVIEKVNTELLDKYIPKGNRLRYDVNKIDSIKQDMPEKELLYKKFEATGNPTLIKSIQEKGIQEPIEIVISKKLSKNNTASVGQMLLSDGHHRLEAAKQLNLTEVPVTVRVKETLDITDLKNDPNPVLLDTKGLKEGNYYKLSDLDLDKRVSFDSTSRIPTDLIYKNLESSDAPKGLMSKPTEDLVPIMPVNQASLVDRGFDYKAGGEYVNPINKEILTNKNASSINIKIDPTMDIKGGRPQASMKAGGFDTDTVGSSGSAIKVNLIKPTSKGNKGKGWNFVSKNDDIEDTNTLIAVTQGNKHYYTLETDFSKGGNLKTYPNSKDEPRLRPTVNGKLEFGEIIGKIKMGKKDDAPVHNLYRKITTYSGGGFVSRR